MNPGPTSTSGGIEQASGTLCVSIGAVSEGGLREENQDCMTGFSTPFGAAYLVADGMGGHRGGAEASRLVVDAVSRHLQAAPPSSPIADALTLSLRLANLEVLEKGKSGNADFAGMGSTVALALLSPTTGLSGGMELTTAHVGDSRIYLDRGGALTRLTRDHTHIQGLIDSHDLDEESARHHPDASVLTRAMGHTTDLEVDITGPIPLASGDGILLCSDGLSGFVGSDAIRHTIADNPEPAECARRLVELALGAGSNDNITVQFLRVAETMPAAARTRSRQTAAEELPVPPAPARRRWRLPALVAAILLITLATLAASAWVYRSRRASIAAALPKKMGPQLQRARDLKQNAARCESDAGKARDQAHKDLANRTDAFLQQIEPLEQEFESIRSAAHKVEQDAVSYESEAARLAASSRGQASLSGLQQPVHLTQSIEASEHDLKKEQARMQDAKTQLSDLESRLAAPKK